MKPRNNEPRIVLRRTDTRSIDGRFRMYLVSYRRAVDPEMKPHELWLHETVIPACVEDLFNTGGDPGNP